VPENLRMDVTEVQKVIHEGFPLPDEKGIDEGGNGFRVDERGHTACDDERVFGGPPGGFEGNSRPFEEGQDMDKIVFERDGKGKDVKGVKGGS
jgi:hypothetical protein